MTNPEIARLVRRALWRIGHCATHLVELDPNGRVCGLCIVERRAARAFRPIAAIMQ